MSIKLEEGKFYKTKNRHKVKCVKDIPKTESRHNKLCVIYRQDIWLKTSYTEDGVHCAEELCDLYNITSEWTEVDELGLEYGQIVWARDDEWKPWKIGYFIDEKSGNKPYGVTSFINNNGTFATNNPTYYEYIRATQPSNCLSKHGSLEANHD